MSKFRWRRLDVEGSMRGPKRDMEGIIEGPVARAFLSRFVVVDVWERGRRTS